MEKLAKQLTIKYALLQSTYWISQCAINSFAAVFLQSRNFDNTQIGIVLSLAAILSIFLQPLIASFADKTSKVTLRQIVIAFMAIIFAMAFVLYIAPGSFWLIAILYVLINACTYTLNPLNNSLALEYMNQGVPMNYGLARGTGSVAFAVMSLFLGQLVNLLGPDILLLTFLLSFCFTITAVVFFKAKLPESTQSVDLNPTSLNSVTENPGKDKSGPSGIGTFLVKYKTYLLFLVGVAMIFYSHNLINTYLINIIENVGGNSKDLGISLAIAAAFELPAMAGFILLEKRFKCNHLVIISAFFFFLKSLLTWLSPNVGMVYVSMAFQLVSFALFTPASIYYVNSMMDPHDRVKGQATLAVATTGIAGSIANITGGKILDTLGVSDMLMLGTIVTVIGFFIVTFTTKQTE